MRAYKNITAATLLLVMLLCAATFTYADNGGDYEIYVTSSGSDTAGDGTYGNPYATIQKAVDEIPNIVTGCYIISVGSGTYSEQVDILDKVCLGSNTSLTMEGDVDTPANVVVSGSTKGFYVNGSSNVTIKGFKVYNCTDGLEFASSKGCTVSYCESKGNSGNGMIIDRVSNVTVTEFTSEDNQIGTICRNNSSCYITNSHFNDNDNHGIACTGSGYIYAKDNECSNNGDTGTNTGSGIYGEGSCFMDIEDNYSSAGEENAEYGVYAIYGASINDNGDTWPTGAEATTKEEFFGQIF